MGRKKDSIWNHVEKLNDNRFCCNYCGEKFAGGASRIKAHLLGIEGKGIRTCTSIPEDVQIEVRVGDSNEPPCNSVNPYNSQQGFINSNMTSDPSREKSITGRRKDNFWRYVESSSNGKVKCMFCLHEFSGGASRIKWHLSKTEKMGVNVRSNVSKDVQEAAYDASHKRLKINIDSSHNEENFVKSNSLGSSSKGNAKLYPMPTETSYIGMEFQSYIDKIWDWLMNNKEELVIGVCGMGGIGKTILLKHIHNKLLDVSCPVIWVDVPKDSSLLWSQKTIAEFFNIPLMDRDGTNKIAAKLLHAFKKIKRCVIILDDVWECIDLESLGIPFTNSEVQVIIASRLFNVCQIIGCKKHILRMVPLPKYDKDSWHLFLKVLGEDESRLSHEVTDIAKSIVDECHGLPLAIATLAKRMRGKKDIREWKFVLKNLRNSEKAQEDMRQGVLPLLAQSYNHLNDTFLQECFLCCAFILEYDNYSFFRWENSMERKNLIIHLVDEGLIDRKNSLEEQLDDGLIILDKLISNNLLIEDGRFVHIHRLVQVMATSIAERSEIYLVKYSKDLRDLEQEWKENLRRVRMETKEIPSGISPKCPRLSSLNLSKSYDLKLIPDSFFINMPSLKVLNLSHCKRIQHLPTSISNLVSLTALLLNNCSSLESVPSLAKLQKLERLDLYRTSITELPLGLEMLINLRWLDLRGINKLIMLPASVIPNLTNLQVLLLEIRNESMNVKAADLEGLILLENILVEFIDIDEFNDYVIKVVNAQDRRLKNHCLILKRGLEFSFGLEHMADISSSNKAILRSVGIENAAPLLLPISMDELIIEDCDDWGSLCDVLSFDDENCAKSPKFSSCTIESCTKLEHVFCLSSFCSFCSSIHGLESLSLTYLESLSMICKETNVAIAAPRAPFPSLRYLNVYGCHLLKTLLTPGMIGHLQNLETLYVICCNAIEEIFSSEKNNECIDALDSDYQLLEELFSSEMGRNYQEKRVADAVQIDHSHPTKIQLPKLKYVILERLDELERVYEGTLACDSLQQFKISECSNLEQLPQIEPFFEEFEIEDCPYLEEEEDSSASSDEELEVLNAVAINYGHCFF